MSAILTSLLLLATEASPANAIRASLVRSSDQWFHWLVISSIVVGIGVCLEAPEATIALKRWFLHWRGKEVSSENPKSLAIPASYLGLILVVAGVAGEGIFEFLASSADTAVRSHDEQVLADTIKEAGDAAASAKNAETAADDAKTKGAQAQASAADVGKKAEQVNQALGMAQFFLSDRDILDPDGLKAKLSKFAGKTILFRSYVNDGDG